MSSKREAARSLFFNSKFKRKNKILIQAKKYETPVFKTKNQRITKHMTLKTFTFIKKHITFTKIHPLEPKNIHFY